MKPYRILVVEDEAVVAMDIEERPAGMGYEFAGQAMSGEEASSFAEEQRPDLILMDIRLKVSMDGITAAEQINRSFRLPVIFLTAYSEEETLERAKRIETFGYILKPFNDGELKLTIEIALYKYRIEEQRREVEEALRESERILRTLFDAVTESLFVFDPEGRVLACKKTFAERLNKLPEDLVGRCIYDHLAPEVAARRRAWVGEVVQTGEGRVFEDDRDGHWICHNVFPVPDSSGVVTRLISFATDLTRQKQAEDATRTSKIFLGGVLNSIHEPIFVKDEGHRFVLVNEVLCRFVGCGRKDLLGKTDLDFFPPEQVKVFRAQDLEVFETGLENVNEEVVTDAAGEFRTVVAKKSRFIDPRGNKYVAGVVHDITARTLAENMRAVLDSE